MKRNPFWDAQAKQYLASVGAAAGGAVPNSLANLAAPGGGLPRAPVPLTAIARPIQPAGPVAPMGAGAAAPAPMPRTSPVRPMNPMPQPAAPVAGAVGGGYNPNDPRLRKLMQPRPVRAAAPVKPVANQGTPFQYNVQRGIR